MPGRLAWTETHESENLPAACTGHALRISGASVRQRNIPRRRGMNCLQENRDRSTLRPRFFAFIFPIQKGGHAQMERYEYPFSALVGQEKLKTALLLNLVEPRLGGVLIQGEKGTAKSTAVRGLAELMDEVEVAEGCPFHCRMDGERRCATSAGPARPCRAVPYRRRVVELTAPPRTGGGHPGSGAGAEGGRPRLLRPACWPRPMEISSLRGRSTTCWGYQWTCCWTPPPWGSTPWSGRGSPTAIRPASSWWAP